MYIQDKATQKYFEMDFAGWNWQESKQGAFKFKTLEHATEYLKFLLPEYPQSEIENT